MKDGTAWPQNSCTLAWISVRMMSWLFTSDEYELTGELHWTKLAAQVDICSNLSNEALTFMVPTHRRMPCDFARIKAKQIEVHPKLYHQRMEDFNVPHRYGTIYIANGTFMAISDRQKALSTLERFRNHLISGGQLLIELSIPDEAKGVAVNAQYWGPTKCASGEGEISTKLWTESFDLWEQTMLEKRRYELKVDGQLVRSELHTLHMRWYYKYEFTMMLEKAGFKDIHLYSDYTEEPASKESKTIVYGARNLSI